MARMPFWMRRFFCFSVRVVEGWACPRRNLAETACTNKASLAALRLVLDAHPSL